MIDIQDLKNASESYANLIRQYVKDTAFLWRKLPYYCLMADGKTGYSDRYYTCYMTDCYRVDYRGDNYVYIDCKNFNIVTFWDTKTPACNLSIISLPWYVYDVNRILNTLKEHSRKEESSYITPLNGDKNWRLKVAEERNLYD